MKIKGNVMLTKVECVGRAMAEMDGRSQYWDAERDGKMDYDDAKFTGHYIGYNSEADRIIEVLNENGYMIVRKK